MTKVFIHGILGQEFGREFNFDLGHPRQVVDAIDACRSKFRSRINKLAIEGCHYTILVNKRKIGSLTELELHQKADRIDLIPAIAGAAAAIGALLISSFTSATFAAAAATTGAALLGSVVLTAVSVGLQLLLTPKPDAGPPISATTRALQESFLFSNKANLATQGSPVPIGFGRLRVGSQVVQFCNKSFPQSRSSTDAMLANPFEAKDITDGSDNPAIIDTRA